MSQVKKVWVLAEKTDALAQLCAGGRQLGEEVGALVWGSRAEAEKAAAYGADKVYWLGSLEQGRMLEDYHLTISELLKKETPDLLLVQPSRRGKHMAGRLAAGLGTSVIVDAADITIVQGDIQIKHMVYGGGAFRVERAFGPTTITTVGAGIFSAPAEASGHQGEIDRGEIVEVEFREPAVSVKCLEKKSKAGAEVNLNAAKRVLGVGRGFAEQADLKMAEELAGLIGAEVGCSRPIAEGVNWMARERYIGVSGAMLKPELYLAIGISGQVQHMVGANQAKTIIAINKDKGAPIFQQADYGIVGDLSKILPALSGLIKANR
ncbi:FAD-binding protein [Desulfitobacterium chlororespirans]|uniref:Electron transfer flavoprotein alpha subunit apoprotein n=1 Tax=Desulfitobacterium chlororespirans DSM 11544 TaxID=1121395 RepID=A0A1M7UB40_9FIRM|nr:FAD-binding protein [Desulfitobacterium chlororespirans]SHN80097.1 electron transfer flavoprotein alpha subunit apoprotein [Desulfitobacterium chlororespirans DSM 11544]